MAEAEGTAPKRQPLKVPQEQWDWFAGFAKDGRMLTLREYVSEPEVYELDELTDDQMTRLTIERVKVNPDIDMMVLGVRKTTRITQQSALGHLAAGLEDAPHLCDIEKRVLEYLIPVARAEARRTLAEGAQNG